MIFTEKLQKTDLDFAAFVFLGCVAVYLISFLGYFFYPLKAAIFLTLLLLAAFFSLKRPEMALAMAFFELFLGSKGYLFSFEISGIEISLRMGLFLVIVGAWIGKWIFGERKKIPMGRFIPLIFFIFLAAIRGEMRGNNFDDVFNDANGFFFFGYLGLAASAFNKKNINKYLLSFAAGIAALWAATMFLAVLFSSGMLDLGSAVYKWVRVTGLGEITIVSNDFSRVFLQSHVFALFGFLLFASLAMGVKEKTKNIFYLVFSILAVAILIVDLSRSFWVGAAVGAAALVWIFAKQKQETRQKFFLPGLSAIAALVLSSLLLPALPQTLTGRGSSISDPAASSRRAMLKPILSEIKKAPIFGSGFGTLITYKTLDPRALERNPSGEVTTFAFEWGWLDLWVKMGLFGVLAYIWLIFCVLRRLYKAAPENRPLAYGLFAAIIALAATHMFSPYLNHPLGISLLLFADAVAENVYTRA